MIGVLERRRKWLAFCLTGLAGYVDGLGFLAAGGMFVSFMSGNSTRLAIGAAERSVTALIALGLIGAFLTGVIAATLVATLVQKRRKSAVLGLVSLLLASSATLAHVGAGAFAPLLMAAAMGAENLVFQRDGEVSIGLTYMTGAVVKAGQRIGMALLGGPRWDWLPHLLLWSSLVTGAIIGALSFHRLGVDGLWFAALAALLLAVWAGLIERTGEPA
ncbi:MULTISPECIES: YoaK family protein [Sphingomonas]|jgi:uncharacterized membrane protein YoaK (UPF0700 family)|uniref:Major facilitator superfamily (MFS) profile domain-containing protein n=1 Tax=Sphingomonas sanxanigenens DSM 19645 = NX02 TaxID=1123269 RepID=A0A0F7JVK5_9SPHN|nr:MULTISPECIES: YoaK family protein [Sphingomonas]AKH18728.1 hypothetical protein NX02_p0435 [Sphingomonas sanxanigenens DSM 19645 = NX02]